MRSVYDETVLTVACLNPDITLHTLQMLIKASGQITQLDCSGRSLLQYYLMNKQSTLDGVYLFISSGVDLNNVSKARENCLFQAFRRIPVSSPILYVLIEAGVDPTLRNNQGRFSYQNAVH